ncbi:SIMPL domain-containing protein [Anaerocellum danielii]|uniref:SIMPL domain-containing protein n=1 Tax=Anaerocellum danielii TaxID=1387557 RepID=A0ABZ0U3C3_9FIRM|nr:SIMPL domain-containing protein [Caldicellulosiruptor danielii]WPX09228.1 SIMPL domain-containing protein [Caldicellulosiruptor danielii]
MNNKNFTYVLVALIIGISFTISSYFLSNGLINLRAERKVIKVTGSAKKQLRSDLVKWTGMYSVQAKDLKEAYKLLEESQKKVKDYFLSKGLSEKDLIFSSISTQTIYEMLPNGLYSTKVDSYRLVQSIQITSKDVDRITELSRQSTELINLGVQFESFAPQYYYTKLADLKVDMLSLATKDAIKRAQQIAESTGIKVGSLRSASMGVFQITPLYSTDVSDYGINDTSSVDKEITAIVNCEFAIK